MTKGNILWIENHKLPILTEIPMLRNMGFQVYTPKILPFDTGVRLEQDVPALDFLSTEEQTLLDETDFYQEGPSRRVMDIISRHFDMVFFGFVPASIEKLVDAYPGLLVLRAYGREKRLGTYTQGIVTELGLFTLHKIEQLGARFVFAQAFPHLADVECSFFCDHKVDFPLCLSLFATQNINTWTGGTPKVLYSCPGLRMIEDRAKLYETFAKDFPNMPYAVCGAQPIPVEADPKVLGWLPDEEYRELFDTYACLYDDSVEPWTLSPALLDALRSGMPIVYEAGGILDRLLEDEDDHPGRCENDRETRKRLLKMLRQDRKLTAAIQRAQAGIMESFSEEACMEAWQEAFAFMEKCRKVPQIPLFGKQKKRVAVLLPEAFTGGVLDYTIRLTQALQSGLAQRGDEIEFVFGHVDSPAFARRDYFRPLREMGIPVRAFSWELLTNGRAQEITNVRGYGVGVIPVGTEEDDAGQSYCVPNDGIAYFEDCDYLLFTSDRIPGFPLLMQPYGMISHDFVQRFVPGIIDPPRNEDFLLQSMRRAKAVYTTTPITAQRAVQYGGVSARRIHRIPFFFSAENGPIAPARQEDAPAPYFLWSTNTTPHKRHLEALSALSEYYASEGGLDCYVTGVRTQEFSPNTAETDEMHDYLLEIRVRIAQDPVLCKRMHFFGNLPKLQYQQILREAQFFFHPGFADNGNGTAFDAAWEGVPTLSNDYEAMRYYDQEVGLGMRFFRIDDPESVVGALHQSEREYKEFAAGVPSREILRAFTVENQDRALAIYHAILEPAALV